jgi:hypothetical protein
MCSVGGEAAEEHVAVTTTGRSCMVTVRCLPATRQEKVHVNVVARLTSGAAW